MTPPAPRLRLATLDEVPALEALIAASAHGLSRGDYTEAQVEAALGSAFGVDTQLILDGTYFVVEVGDECAACGGWSYRKTLFGADAEPGRDPESLDPAVDAARVRAFFVHPRWARRGIGTMLLEACETAAREHGFRTAALMATLPGRRLYAAAGYLDGEPVDYDLPGGVTIRFVPMTKAL